MVVREAAIAADLGEFGEEAVDVVQNRRAVGVPRHQDALPRRQLLVDVCADRLNPRLQPVDRLLPLGRLRQERERLDLLLQDADGLFKFKQIGRHAPSTVPWNSDGTGQHSQRSWELTIAYLNVTDPA